MITRIDNIPDEIRAVKQWVCWVGQDKIPKNAKTGGNAMSNNPETWCTFDEAVEGCEEIIAGHTGEKTKRGYLAFPVDEHFRRADGKSFNCIYRMIE